MLVQTMNAKRVWFLSFLVGVAATGCAAIVGADDYSVGEGSTGTGGSSTGSGGTGGNAGKDGGAGVGGNAGDGGTSGTGGSAGKGGGAGATGGTSGGRGGSGGTGGTPPPDAGGRGGSTVDSGPVPPDGGGGSGGGPGVDAGPTCNAQTPAGTAMCGAGKSCLLSTCGPPATYDCYAAGSLGDGAFCDPDRTECASGLICLTYGTDLNVCRRTCTVDAECATGSRCIGSLTSCAPQNIMGQFCERLCSDITRAGAAVCGPGFKCDASCGDTSPNPATCFKAGTLTSGACSAISDCAAGYSCIGSVCRQACKTNVDCAVGACTGGLFCGNTDTGFRFCE